MDSRQNRGADSSGTSMEDQHLEGSDDIRFAESRKVSPADSQARISSNNNTDNGDVVRNVQELFENSGSDKSQQYDSSDSRQNLEVARAQTIGGKNKSHRKKMKNHFEITVSNEANIIQKEFKMTNHKKKRKSDSQP